FSPKALVQSYKKRGMMENYIKEAKNGFYLVRMSSHSFTTNEVRMMLSLLTYNLTNWLLTLFFPNEKITCKYRPSVQMLLKQPACWLSRDDPITLNYLPALCINHFFGMYCKKFRR